MSSRSRKTFEHLVTLPDKAIPLAETALLMACEEYPQIQISPYVDKLDEIAQLVRQDLLPGEPLQAVERINAVLFDRFGFSGNAEDYYDPRNSFFNDVLDRRVGIPITLSAVYLEVARRVNFPLKGVGMPGHFLVKYADPELEFFIDPFNRGQILNTNDCRERLHDLYGGQLEFSDRLLATTTTRQILTRMLNNLKLIYLKSQVYDKGRAIVDMMLMVEPEDHEQYRDRGLLSLHLRQFARAARDLDHYVRAVPDASDREEIEAHLRDLRRIRAMMN